MVKDYCDKNNIKKWEYIGYVKSKRKRVLGGRKSMY